MGDESRGLRISHAAWCLWFALLMTAPYPAGIGDAWFIAYGAVSESKVFAYASAGVVAGLWVATLPHIERLLVMSRPVRIGLTCIGVSLSAITLAAVWLNFAYMLFCVPEYSLSWAAVLLAESGDRPVMGLLYHLGDMPIWGVLASGFACGAAAVAVFHVKADPCDGDITRSCPAGLPAVLSVSFLLGLARTPAWVLLMPHNASFPQPLLSVDSIGAPWDIDTLGLSVLLVAVATALVFAQACAALVLLRPTSRQSVKDAICSSRAPILGHPGLLCVAAFCLGNVAFRVVVRIVPDLLRITFAWSVGMLLVYLLGAGIYFLSLIRLARRGGAEMPLPTPSSDRLDNIDLPQGLAVAAWERARLLSYGLTEKEMLVFRAYELGLASAQAGKELGIAEPTVREYRRRCRVKMGVSSMDEALALLGPSREGEFAKAQPKSVQESSSVANCDAPLSVWRLPLLAQGFSLFLCGGLVLFPISGAVTRWSDVWTTGFGLASGLVLAWICLMLIWGVRACRSKRRVIVGATLALSALVASGSVVILMQLGLLPELPEGLHRLAYAAGLAFALGSLVVIFRAYSCAVSRAGICDAAYLGQLVGVVLAAGAAHFIPGIWLAMCVLSFIALLSSSVLSLRGFCTVFYADDESGRLALELDPPTPLGFAWLLAAGLVMWTWGEMWRAQAYESSLPLLQWGVAILLCIALAHMVRMGKMRAGHALCVLVATVASAFLRDCAFAVVGAMILLASHHCLFKNEAPTKKAVFRAWHSPLLSGAFILGIGTLATNYAGAVKVHILVHALESALDSGMMIAAAILVLIAFVIGLSVWETACGGEISLSLTGKERVRSALMARGLSEPQVEIVLLLAEGASVGEVAAELNYSRSTVALARRCAYVSLGVTDRSSLSVALNALSGE